MRSPEKIFDTREHCTDITIEEIINFLSKIMIDVKNNRFTISQQNEKNIKFLESSEYIINNDKIKNILLNLTYKNFCWYQKGENEGDLLFVFRYDGKFLKLMKGEPQEDILILYIKINKKEKGSLVISFHPSDNPDELITLF